MHIFVEWGKTAKKSSNFLHTLLICPRKMTSANDEFMILTVGWLSTHLCDDKMPFMALKGEWGGGGLGR